MTKVIKCPRNLSMSCFCPSVCKIGEMFLKPEATFHDSYPRELDSFTAIDVKSKIKIQLLRHQF
jgi:hypothetical protein